MGGSPEARKTKSGCLDSQDLTGMQREVYDRIVATMVPWADAAHFQSKTAGGRLIGPFNPLLFSPAIASCFFASQAAEEVHTTLSERMRQVVILAVGAVWKSEYELYAHSAVARKAGLSEQVTRTLAAGGLSDDLSEQEKIAQRYVTQLAAYHHVDDPLYRAAEAAFGGQGLVDIALLMGLYQTVCGLLNGFDIPAPAMPTDAAPRARLTTAASFLPPILPRKSGDSARQLDPHHGRYEGGALVSPPSSRRDAGQPHPAPYLR